MWLCLRSSSSIHLRRQVSSTRQGCKFHKMDARLGFTHHEPNRGRVGESYRLSPTSCTYLSLNVVLGMSVSMILRRPLTYGLYRRSTQTRHHSVITLGLTDQQTERKSPWLEGQGNTPIFFRGAPTLRVRLCKR